MKKRFIAGVMALTMVLAGTGYAYWTDSLSITTKATTGDMQVKFLDLGLYAQYGDECCGWSIVDGVGKTGYIDANYFLRGSSNYNKIAKDGSIESYNKAANGYNNIKFDAKLESPTKLNVNIGDYKSALNIDVSDGIEINVNNMYPGYAQAFRTDIANVGNIAAKLSKISIKSSGEDTGNIKDMMGVAMYIAREYCKESPTQGMDKVVGVAENFAPEDTFTVGNVKFVRLSAIEKKGFTPTIENSNLLSLDCVNRMDVVMGIAMDPDATGTYTTGSTDVMNVKNNDEMSMDKSVKISVKFFWDQFNAGKGVDAPANILKKQNPAPSK